MQTGYNTAATLLFTEVTIYRILYKQGRATILSKLNHGFHSGRSCETQLLTTMNDILKSFGSGLQTDVAILDFRKAFNTVRHRKLMHKLENYSINGSIHKWISHFLMNQTMKVVLDGDSSDEVMKFR